MAWVIKKPGAFYGWDFWGYTQNGRLHDEGRWVGRGDAKLYETWGDARDALISMMESKGKEAIGKLGIKFEEVPAAENESSNWVIVRDANGAREVYTPKGSWSRTFERAMLCTKSAAEAKQRVLSGTPGAPWCWVQTAEVAKERMKYVNDEAKWVVGMDAGKEAKVGTKWKITYMDGTERIENAMLPIICLTDGAKEVERVERVRSEWVLRWGHGDGSAWVLESAAKLNWANFIEDAMRFESAEAAHAYARELMREADTLKGSWRMRAAAQIAVIGLKVEEVQ